MKYGQNTSTRPSVRPSIRALVVVVHPPVRPCIVSLFIHPSVRYRTSVHSLLSVRSSFRVLDVCPSIRCPLAHGIYRTCEGLRMCNSVSFLSRDGGCIHFKMNMQYRPTCTILRSYFTTYFVIMYVCLLKFMVLF